MRKAFCPADFGPWQLFNEDGTIHAEYSAREGVVVEAVIEDGNNGLRLPTGEPLTQEPDGRMSLRASGSPIGAYQRYRQTGLLATFAPRPEQDGIAFPGWCLADLP